MFLADGKSGPESGPAGTESGPVGTESGTTGTESGTGLGTEYFVNAKNIVIIVFYDKDVIYYIKIGSNGSIESALTKA